MVAWVCGWRCGNQLEPSHANSLFAFTLLLTSRVSVGRNQLIYRNISLSFFWNELFYMSVLVLARSNMNGWEKFAYVYCLYWFFYMDQLSSLKIKLRLIRETFTSRAYISALWLLLPLSTHCPSGWALSSFALSPLPCIIRSLWRRIKRLTIGLKHLRWFR